MIGADLITQSEYARRRGVAKSAVHKAVATNRISLIDGKVDPVEADLQWKRNTRARVDSGRPSSDQIPPPGASAAPALATPPAAEPCRARSEEGDAQIAEAGGPGRSVESSFELLQRAADGDCDATTLRWLKAAFAASLRCGGTVSLERLLHLPTTKAKWREARRNHWLRQAARHVVHVVGTWTSTLALNRDIDTFVTRGPWRLWRECETPPQGASAHSTAMFHALKASDGEVLSDRALFDIVRSVFNEKLRAKALTLVADQPNEVTHDRP